MAEIDNVLFVRSLQNTDSADSDEMDIAEADKGIIVNTFNDMIKISHEDIAKNLAASTSLHLQTEKEGQEKESEESQDEGSHDFDIVDIPVWEIGCDCRVTFKEDKVDYEATIIDIYHDYTCLVEFVGYGNQQIEDLDKLLPSWGLEAQKKQIQESEHYYAKLENKDSTGHEYTNEKNRQNRANRTRNNKIDSELFGPGLLPPQPPLPPMLANGGPSDDPEQNEALSAMLMSWYMSGYYTGLYHGQLKGKKV